MGSIDSLANDISRELQRYGKEVEEKLEVEKEAVANNLVSDLEENSPKNTGKYAKGWRKKKEGDGYIVHNALKPQLTYLLEKGHAQVNGGRVPAKVHIAPAEERAENELLERVERAIQQ
ncbi:HK97 gp10 family phage protein [Bacillus cereus]